MPTRKPTGNTQQDTPLRRSPRLLQLNKITKSPESSLHKSKSGSNRVRSVSLPRASTSARINLEEKSDEACVDTVSKESRKPSNDVQNGGDGFSFLRRSPRFCNKGRDDGAVQNDRSDGSRKVSECVSDKAAKKNKGRSRVFGSVNESINAEVNGGRGEEGENFRNQNGEKRKLTFIVGLRALTAEERRQGKVACRGNKVIEAKLKRKCREEGNGVVQGWTKEQEVALQRAYFAAKPTPHFWKKVSKLVPGKSAQDCFDKIHSDLVTPPQPRTRSRAIGMSSSPIEQFSLSASKLLQSTEPEKKRSRCNKQKSHVTQKTVRKLLRRHYYVNQDNEADLFSIFEPDVDPSTHVLPDAILSTPQHSQEKHGCLHKYHETSSAGSKKNLPRFSSSCTTALVSPPVLKPVKNKALHEKYIDRLHSREAKRKAVSVQTKRSFTGKENARPIHIQNTDVVRAAKQALVSDARDVIDQFQHLQTNTTSDSSDLDDNGGASDDDNEGDIEI
ncbi:hypothetical protein SLEP1_g8402 [Rubroshorea leprosula]|uniref:Myb-like domain-containing protein n=1 Tax=Rubroshorea leprosula TaxID=152421 RepID=A0AAV5I9G8_9ROSI|nr:hypothetical protein SLEP1_g8402 [Rubroshorea leprosula]